MRPIEAEIARAEATAEQGALTAPIFDIQGFSLQDGPGIRTTVFFKGCPLRCRWCHNPESYRASPQIMFHANLCAGCMACTKACLHGVHTAQRVEGNVQHWMHTAKCIGCAECLQVCCYDALALLGKRYTPQALCDAVQRDLRYHTVATAKGQTGGITLSGGEPMLYPDFIQAFLHLLPSQVHVAMETSGCANTQDYLRLAPIVKLFLFDYKATDPDKHRALCGIDNTLILRNLEALYRAGCEIVLRLPLIPGVNDDDAHLAGIAALLRRYPNIASAEIMAYHTLGVGKAQGLGMDAPLAELAAATKEQAQAWLAALHALGATNVVLSR